METGFTFQFTANIGSSNLPNNSSINQTNNLDSSSICGHCGTGGSPVSNNGSARAFSKDGNIAFENENYDIQVSDTGEILIDNKNTGEHYRIWGDPHVDVDGKRAFDFKGDTTFVLDDGTKVTIETTPWRGNNGQTISSKVSIIDGNSSFGVKISGVDDNQTGDLSFETTQNFGAFLDASVEDGNYIHENAEGKGFIAIGPDGWAEVDQSIMDFQENHLRKLASGEAFSNSENQNRFTLESFGQLLDQWLADYQQSEQTSPILEAIHALLSSFNSLAHQQARPMGYFSGLNSIQTNGVFDYAQEAEPFRFELNFYRA